MVSCNGDATFYFSRSKVNNLGNTLEMETQVRASDPKVLKRHKEAGGLLEQMSMVEQGVLFLHTTHVQLENLLSSGGNHVKRSYSASPGDRLKPRT